MISESGLVGSGNWRKMSCGNEAQSGFYDGVEGFDIDGEE